MLSQSSLHRQRTGFHPNTRILEPDPPETWSADEVELLLWPDTPDHLPERIREEGWPELLRPC